MIINRKCSYQNMNQFNFRSKPLASLNLPQIIQIKSLEVSAHGQQGVIFIEITQGSFIIKPSLSVPKQIFYNKMAKQLGLRVPSFNFFSIQDQVHSKLLKSIKKYCATNDQCLFARLRSKFNSLFYAIIQYVPSIGLQHIGNSRFQKMLLNPQRLHQLGLCLGFDMIINNNDRFQCIWSGDGNLGNVLIQVPNFSSYELQIMKSRDNLTISLGSLVFIDNQGHMCNVKHQNVAKNIEFYINKVVNFLRYILNYLECPQVNMLENQNICKFIVQLQLYTGYRLKENQIKQIILGIKDVFQCFIYCHKMKKFHQILEEVVGLSIKMPVIGKQWIEQLQNVNMNYCDLFYENVRTILKYHNTRLGQIKRKQLKEPDAKKDSSHMTFFIKNEIQVQ